MGNGGAGKPWELENRETQQPRNGNPGNRKTVGIGEPGLPRNCRETTGSGKRETRAPGSRGNRGTGEWWARENRGHRERVNRGHWRAATLGTWGNRCRFQDEDHRGGWDQGADTDLVRAEPCHTHAMGGGTDPLSLGRDTAGQERYQTITKQYYRRAQGIFLVYDISSERSYQHIVKWASDVDEYAPDGVQKILIGNKADEEHKSWPGNTGWISTRPVPAATSTSRSPSHG
ncbi:ras-related protein Rab-15 isoform X1 [Agelaius phoeniceus]|uniref:ras-related protein Rab-15 isoform X1 n=1 Tax=Agelaius phoeniceus TaxID=39638 RepID=UPI004054B929